MLGQIDGFFSVGECYSIWDQYVLRNRVCGCGVPFQECTVWRNVFTRAYGGFNKAQAHEMSRAWRAHFRTRHIPYLLLTGHTKQLGKRVEGYLSSIGELYSSIAATTSSDVIVDSSKYPTYAQVLSMIPSVDLSVVHLIRDPRAVAYSWQKQKTSPDGVHMNRMHPAIVSSLWAIWNVTGELFERRSPTPYLRVRYEDFVDRAPATLETIVDFVGKRSRRLSFVSDDYTQLGTTHNLEGNPSRFDSGKIQLAVDDAWKRELPPHHRRLVTALTWPLLRRYRYPSSTS
jgi:hypothetical protein